MYIGLRVKYPLFLSDFNQIWTFSTDFLKIIEDQISLRIRPVGAELFHENEANKRITQFFFPHSVFICSL